MKHMTIFEKIQSLQNGNRETPFCKRLIQNKSRIMRASISLDYILFISPTNPETYYIKNIFLYIDY